jgi:hypothetical protein
MLNLTIKVENAYSDGHTSEQIHQVDLGRFRGDEALWDELWEYTGDGHGDSRDLCAIYTVTILESPQFPPLVGLSNEWG